MARAVLAIVVAAVRTAWRDPFARKINKGNGFFEDKYCTRDKYREEPIYDTWVRYRIWKWVSTTPETKTGTDRNPVFPTVYTHSKRREAGRSTEYTIFLSDAKAKKDYEYSANEATWKRWNTGDELVAAVNNLGSVVRVRAPGENEH